MTSDPKFLHPTARIYRNVRLDDSTLGAYSTVGDDSILLKTDIEGYSTIARRNRIQEAHIGLMTYTGNNTTILASNIGRFSSISWNVSIGGKNHDLENVSTFSLRSFERNLPETSAHWSQGFEYAKDQPPCAVESDVWIGAAAVILRGVRVHVGAVIGAGAIVTKDVEPYSIVAGVPARRIGMRFDSETVQHLLEIRWWDWSIEKITRHKELLFATEINCELLDKLRNLGGGLVELVIAVRNPRPGASTVLAFLNHFMDILKACTSLKTNLWLMAFPRGQ